MSGAGMARALFGAGAVAAALGCGDDSRSSIDFGFDDDTLFAGAEPTLMEGDEFAALTDNGAVKLGLTADRVYFQLSDAVREHVDREIESGLEGSDSRLARSIGSAVRRGVARAMDMEVDFRLEQIRDVDYRDGELVFDFVDRSDARKLRNIDMDDRPLTRAFSEKDARAFVTAFRRVKAEAGHASVSGSASTAPSAGEPSAAARPGDTAGGVF